MNSSVAKFDRESLMHELGALAPWKRAAFMALTCERLLPNYVRFAAETDFGNVSILRNALNAVWLYVASGAAPNDLDQLERLCEQQAPDTERFSSPFTSAALDAVNAIAATLDAVRSQSAEVAAEVAEYARDTIDLFVQEKNQLDPNAPDLEERITLNPLMQRELKQQRQDIRAVAEWPEHLRQSIEMIRTENSVRGSLA